MAYHLDTTLFLTRVLQFRIIGGLEGCANVSEHTGSGFSECITVLQKFLKSEDSFDPPRTSAKLSLIRGQT